MLSSQPIGAAAAERERNPIRDAIAEAIAEHRVILFMKGTPEAPACGFSARTVAALQALDTPFAAVDVLPDPRIRQELSAISNWPTIPQLFVNGELVGGCDIVTEMYESGELARGVACSVSRRMPPVAVATDSTHYLPRALADREGIHQVSLYVGWKGEPERELEMEGFDAFYERLRTDPELPTTSQPSIGDFLAVWEPLLAAGQDVVSIHLAGGISGTCEAARQAHGLLAERGLGERVEVIDGETALWRIRACCCSPRAAAARAGARQRRGDRARARDAQGAADLVLPGHARVPAARRAHRQGPGVDRRHAEDQADPLARVRDRAGRARAHRRAGVRAHGQVRRRSSTTSGSDGWVVQHIQAPEQAAATDRPLPGDLRLRARLHLGGRAR